MATGRTCRGRPVRRLRRRAAPASCQHRGQTRPGAAQSTDRERQQPNMQPATARPAWSSLTSRHQAFADGTTGARRYQPSIVPFAAARDDSPESLEALAALVPPEESALLLQACEIRLPASL